MWFMLLPGVYEESVTLKDYVSLEAAGQESTTISSSVSDSGSPPAVAHAGIGLSSSGAESDRPEQTEPVENDVAILVARSIGDNPDDIKLGPREVGYVQRAICVSTGASASGCRTFRPRPRGLVQTPSVQLFRQTRIQDCSFPRQWRIHGPGIFTYG